MFGVGWNAPGPRTGEERSLYAARVGGEEGRWRLSIVDERKGEREGEQVVH
jgi:hypothetical protein